MSCIKLCLIVFLFNSVFLYPQDILKYVNSTSYVDGSVRFELMYTNNLPFYVSDELSEPLILKKKINSKTLEISYYPRNNMIISGNEKTFWPPIVRRIDLRTALIFRENISKIVDDQNVDNLRFIVYDYVFLSKSYKSQLYLTKEEYISKKIITSCCLTIKKSDDGLWYILNKPEIDIDYSKR